MSGRISIAFVDFAAFSFEVDRVRGVSLALFLVRNWCGGISTFVLWNRRSVVRAHPTVPVKSSD
jgi:hypothetical protein